MFATVRSYMSMDTYALYRARMPACSETKHNTITGGKVTNGCSFVLVSIDGSWDKTKAMP